MKIKDRLVYHYRKDTGKILCNAAINTPEIINELMACFCSDNLRLCQRASDPLTLISLKSPSLLDNCQQTLLKSAQIPPHNSAIRNALRIFQHLKIQETISGELFDLCYQKVQNIQEATGIRVFAASVMKNIANDFPELNNELLILFDEFKSFGTIGFKNRIQKLILEIEQQNH